MKTTILLGALIWALACGDAAGPGAAPPDAGPPGVAVTGKASREPDADATTVSTCSYRDPACRIERLPPQELGLPDPAEPDRPSGPAPDPSPIDRR